MGLSVGLFSGLVCLVLAELALRLLAPQPASWLAIYQHHPRLPIYALLPDLEVPIYTGETDWLVRTDSKGFRYPGSEPADRDCVALWLGDSYAFGHGVDYEESFIGLVGAQTPETHHINAAVSGYGPVQYRQILEDLIESGMSFDHLIVASYVGNDFHDGMRNKDRRVVDGVIGHRGDLRSYIKMNLHLYRLLSSVFHRFSKREVAPFQVVYDQLASPAAWDEEFLAKAREIYVEEMGRIEALGREHGAKVIFMLLPTHEAVEAEHAAVPDSTRQPLLPIQKARAGLETFSGDMLDMTGVLAQYPADEVFFQFDGHLNYLGNQSVAQELVKSRSLTCAGGVAGR